MRVNCDQLKGGEGGRGGGGGGAVSTENKTGPKGAWFLP